MKRIVKISQNLFDFLHTEFGYTSKTKIRKLVKNGTIKLDGIEITRTGIHLLPGQTVEIHHFDQSNVPATPYSIIYEDHDLIAVDKPSGILTMGSEREKTKTLLFTLNHYLHSRSNRKERAFIVHRLDREASGILLLAKSPEIKRTLQNQWIETEKIYYALTEGHPPETNGTIDNWLRENRFGKMVSCEENPGAQKAVTHYQIVKEYKDHTLLQVQIKTGRKNQIRVHLSDLGCPVIGDEKYGAKENLQDGIGLHAFSLCFSHPRTGKRIRLKSAMPERFNAFLQKRDLFKK